MLTGPQWSSIFPKPALHLTPPCSPGQYQEPQLPPGGPQPSCLSLPHPSTHHSPSSQVCKPSVNYIPGCQQLPSCPPGSFPALQASSYSMCLIIGNLAGNPLQAPWGPDPQQPALAPLPCHPLAHTPTGISLNTPGCYTCVQEQALFPTFHGVLNPISSFRSLPWGILLSGTCSSLPTSSALVLRGTCQEFNQINR